MFLSSSLTTRRFIRTAWCGLVRSGPLVLLGVLSACGGGAPTAATPSTEPSAPSAPVAADAPAAAQDTNAPATDGTSASSSGAQQPAPAAPVVAQGCPEPKDRSRVQVSAADVQELVNANRPHLHAACWKPAIVKKPKGPDKVRIATELQIEGDGSVKEVKVVGGNDYEGFAACVERELKAWCFPGAKQPTSLMFPMIFVKAEGEMMEVPAGSRTR